MKVLTNLAIAVALFSSCSTSQAQPENRAVAAFTKIESHVPLDIILEKGSKENVSIEVSGIEPQKIMTVVEGNALKVNMEKGSYNNLKGKIIITFVNLSELTNSGSGDVTCKSDISSNDFSLNSNGSGDITLSGKMKVNRFNFQHKGSGDVDMGTLETTDLNLSMMGSGDFKAEAGTAQKQTISLMGSGDVEMENVSGESCTVAIKGSGDVKVNVNNTLQGSILGSGNVSYKGDPKVKQVEVKGSGNVSKL